MRFNCALRVGFFLIKHLFFFFNILLFIWVEGLLHGTISSFDCLFNLTYSFSFVIVVFKVLHLKNFLHIVDWCCKAVVHYEVAGIDIFRLLDDLWLLLVKQRVGFKPVSFWTSRRHWNVVCRIGWGCRWCACLSLQDICRESRRYWNVVCRIGWGCRWCASLSLQDICREFGLTYLVAYKKSILQCRPVQSFVC